MMMAAEMMRPPLESLMVPIKLPWKFCARLGHIATESVKMSAK
jgi:hypothetical protein